MKTTMSGRILATFAVASFSMSLNVFLTEAAAQSPSAALTLNDPAPTLKAARVIKGNVPRHFEPSQIYVVEFWATWCGPCKKVMPHLSELARKYQGQVTFISVNASERAGNPKLTDATALAQVARFVKDSGNLMDYNVAMDDEANTLKTQWQGAFGQTGIPNAYVVADMKVVWIGDPTDLEHPLTQLLAGTYSASVSEFKQQQADAAVAEKLSTYAPLVEARRKRDYVSQVRILEETLSSNPRLEARFSLEKFRVMQHVDPARASSYAREYVDRTYPRGGNLQNRSALLSVFAGTIVREKSLENPDLDLALQFAQESLDIAPEKNSAIYATLATVYFARHDIAKAIEFQEQAIALAKQTPNYDPGKQALVARYESSLANYQIAERKRAQKGREES